MRAEGLPSPPTRTGVRASGGDLDPAPGEGWEDHDEDMTDELEKLLDSFFLDSVPIARPLMELLEERGWRGWTRLVRIAPA